ncbi:MAG TPA: glucosamine-6-phosphate deaminase [Alphaproteobacteria bacterium]|nr:glucosamine-6-phosphate deaminase [Alphaproteobacteria bacterium]
MTMIIPIRPDVSISANQAAIKAAREIADLLREKLNAVIGLATGGTQVAVYRELVRMHKEEGLDFSHATFFNLDEFIGIPPDHPQSFHRYMNEHFFNHVNANRRHVHIPNGMSNQPLAESARYERMIKEAGGIDLQLLGIGRNGHIGFCEPGTFPNSKTHATALTPETRKDAASSFGGLRHVPKSAITMGMATILRSKRIIMLATGKTKAKAVEAMLTGPVTRDCPGSFLQGHPNVSYYFDQSAYARVAIAQSMPTPQP